MILEHRVLALWAAAMMLPGGVRMSAGRGIGHGGVANGTKGFDALRETEKAWRPGDSLDVGGAAR